MEILIVIKSGTSKENFNRKNLKTILRRKRENEKVDRIRER